MENMRTGIGIWAGRFGTPKLAGQMAKAMEDSGHVDQLVIWDQLNSWWPQALWEPSCTPLANLVPDTDSSADPFVLTAFALAACEKLGFVICTDSMRRDPPEYAQMLLTLAMATEGQATLCLGAGEVRHIGPFGRDRKLGLKRLEDSIQILQLLLKERGLVNFEGKVWTLKDAWIGNGGKEKMPEIVAMGGGPKLTELSVKYADGFSSGAPFVFGRPEKYAETIKLHRAEMAKAGRTNDPYVYGLHHIAFICKSKDDFEQYVDNPLLKWYAATGGRINMADWAEEGVESVMPLDWHYAFDMRPAGMSRAEVDAIISRVTPEMVRKTFFYGTPDDIAREIIPYAKAGANLNLIADISPLMVPTDPFYNIEQMAEVCRLIKAS